MKLAQEKAAREKRGDDPTELQKWYEQVMRTEKPVCWETGNAIDTDVKSEWHGSIAHILPKKFFKSVATHPKNYLILQKFGGTHDRYDANWSKAQKMKVWPLAVERFKQFAGEINHAELKYLPECLVIHLNK